MKRTLAFILCLTAIIGCFTAVAEEYVYFILCKPKGIVNVRKMPKLKSEIVACKYFGDQVITDGKEKNGFIHVIDLAAETEEGWIYGGLLVEDQPVEVDLVTNVFGGRVACRKYINGKRLRWLNDGSSVRVYAITQEWCYTEYGYIKTDFLTLNAGGQK